MPDNISDRSSIVNERFPNIELMIVGMLLQGKPFLHLSLLLCFPNANTGSEKGAVAILLLPLLVVSLLPLRLSILIAQFFIISFCFYKRYTVPAKGMDAVVGGGLRLMPRVEFA